jgi:hypothetical protein
VQFASFVIPSLLGVLGGFAVHTGRLPTVAGPWHPQRHVQFADGRAITDSNFKGVA